MGARIHREHELGATLVEAAFALPIFFLLVLGLVDFGLVGFNDNQAGNAARDGARTGAINYLEADVVGSSDHDAIIAAIEKNLPDRSIPANTSLVVKCIDPDGADVVGGCQDARVDIDRISVKVSWDQEFVSPVAQALGFRKATVDGESAMVIIGAPIGGSGSAPTPCDVTGVTVTPNPTIRLPGGELQSDLTVEVEGSGNCGNLDVTVTQGGVSELLCTGPSCLGVLPPLPADQTDQWSTGLAAVEVTGDDNFTGYFTIVDLNPCTVTGVTVDPSSVQRYVSGPNQGELVENLSVSVAQSGVCTNLTVTLVAPNGSDTAVICTNGSCASSAYLATSDDFWTAGTATVDVSGEATASGTFEVTDAPATCSASVSVSPDTVQASPNDKDLDVPSSITITVTPSGPCSSFDVVLEASDGSTTYPVCSGGCTGTLPAYDPPAASGGDKPWPPGTATVSVTGDATAQTSFEVT